MNHSDTTFHLRPRLLPFLFGCLTYALLLAPAAADDWPQWGGPQRDLVWRETGIVRMLPPGKLPPVWSTPIGEGYAGPAVANDRVYVADRIYKGEDGYERVLALDAADGRILWQHEYPCLYRIDYPAGPRATLTCDGDRVYAVGAMGNLFCFDAATGDIRWSRDFVKDFATRVPVWGIAGAPLVDGDQLILLVGGPDALVVSLNKHTGEVLWRSLDDPDVGYAPPVILDFGGTRQLIVWHPRAVSALDPATGRLLWEVPFRVKAGLTIATPRRHGNRLFVTAFYDGPLMLDVHVDGSGAEVAWRGQSDSERDTDGLHAIMCTPVFTGESIFGVCSYGQLRGLDARTGERLWETRAATGDGRWWNAFLIPHEDRYFLHNEQGELIIARLSPTGYEEISRSLLITPTRPVQRRQTIWSHPAFAMQSVFARSDKEIVRVNLAE